MKTQTNECHGDKGRTRTPKVRVETELSKSLSKRLAGYALAAGAAGVGLLATASPGKADIVYTQANVNFGNNSTTTIDLNHDGVADFTISDRGRFSSFPGPKTTMGRYLGRSYIKFWTGHLSLGLNGHNSAVDNSGGVSRLQAGAQIPPTTNFGFFGKAGFMGSGTADATTSNTASGYKGAWGFARRESTAGVIGLKFLINGQAHYGWAYLEVQSNFGNGAGSGDGGYSGTLVSYAYESCANVGITAGATSGGGTCATPEPGTLGLLALGSLGLGFWRRRKQEPVTSGE